MRRKSEKEWILGKLNCAVVLSAHEEQCVMQCVMINGKIIMCHVERTDIRDIPAMLKKIQRGEL